MIPSFDFGLDLIRTFLFVRDSWWSSRLRVDTFWHKCITEYTTLGLREWQIWNNNILSFFHIIASWPHVTLKIEDNMRASFISSALVSRARRGTLSKARGSTNENINDVSTTIHNHSCNWTFESRLSQSCEITDLNNVAFTREARGSRHVLSLQKLCFELRACESQLVNRCKVGCVGSHDCMHFGSELQNYNRCGRWK